MQVELRRGLPRVAGGQPWPPAGTVEIEDAPAAAAAPTAPPATETAATPLRRGLPRLAGGEPWPPAGTVHVAAPAARPADTPEAATPVENDVDTV